MQQSPFRTTLIHGGLFILSSLTTLMAGAELITGRSWTWFLFDPEGVNPAGQLQWHDLAFGVPYSLSFLTFLTFHEFGHYFTAVYHRVRASLPYYIPIFFPIPGLLNIGSFGAVIRLREVPNSTRKFFDIGIAGPLAGFVVSFLLLIYGFSHLPDQKSYVLDIHPEYTEQFGGIPSEKMMGEWIQADPENRMGYKIGTSLLYEILKHTIPDDPAQVPSAYEMVHYPFLFVGYITLFFTALNLLPMGQLDGGHVIYGMFGRKVASYVARIAVLVLLFLGGTGLIELEDPDSWSILGMGAYLMFLVYIFSRIIGRENWRQVGLMALIVFISQLMIKFNFPGIDANPIWLVYTLMVVAFVGLDHPPARQEHRVNRPRQLLGWLSILIFILCFTPVPIAVVGGG
ncbi:MAG: site-2 protease family protein [Bacteroidota bacterium]